MCPRRSGSKAGQQLQPGAACSSEPGAGADAQGKGHAQPNASSGPSSRPPPRPTDSIDKSSSNSSHSSASHPMPTVSLAPVSALHRPSFPPLLHNHSGTAAFPPLLRLCARHPCQCAQIPRPTLNLPVAATSALTAGRFLAPSSVFPPLCPVRRSHFLSFVISLSSLIPSPFSCPHSPCVQASSFPDLPGLTVRAIFARDHLAACSQGIRFSQTHLLEYSNSCYLMITCMSKELT